MNLFNRFEYVLKADPEREFLLTENDDKFTCADILGLTAQYTNLLKELGAKPGDRITVQLYKSVENMCLYFAALQGGFVFHPLNPAYTPGEVSYFIGNAEPSIIVCDPAKLAAMQALADEYGVLHVETLSQGGTGSLTDKAKIQPSSFKTQIRAGDDLAALLYSSGTTGRPKGIMLSHDNLRLNAESLVQAWGFTAKDRLLHCLPIFHVHGLFVAIGCAVLSGASMRWVNKFSPDTAKKFLPECSSMMGVPTYYTRLLDEPEFTKDHCQNMRLFTSGSAPLLVETHESFLERTGHVILERYGMTETGMNCSNPLKGERKAGTVGPPLPGVEARIVDNVGKPTPLGEVGNLQVRGENVFRGYWRMPEKTAEDFEDDGFFNTGDQATLDEDGYVSIVGRSKDMVITGGLNVYPKEIEDVLDEMVGVLESAVIGVPHPDFGEAVVAVIVPIPGQKPDLISIRDNCKKSLANFKVPKHVSERSELPRNTMGKVQKKALREEHEGLFS